MTSILRPKGLRPGDTVAVAALANERAEEEVPLFEQGFATIESLGYRVAVSPLADPGTPTGGPSPRPRRRRPS